MVNDETGVTGLRATHNSDRGMRVVIIAACLVIVIWGVHLAQSILILLLIAGFLSIIGLAPVGWMRRKGMPSGAAVLIVITGMLGILVIAGTVVGASINKFTEQWPVYQSRLMEMLSELNELAASKGITIPDGGLPGLINTGGIVDATASAFGALSSVLSSTCLILFTVMFILLESESFRAKLRYILGEPQAVFPQFARFVTDLKRYVLIMTILNLSGGILVAIWLSILGVDYAILWGFIAFLLTYIPSIGSIVAAVPAIFLAYVQQGSGTAVLTAVGYVVIGTAIGNIISPKIMGRRLGMSTLVVFLSLIVWGNLLGLVGALLCVPLTMSVMLACEMTEETRWITTLLGPVITSDGKPTKP